MAEEVLSTFKGEIEELLLLPGSGGVFEVTVDGSLIYSKKASGRHAEPGEIVQLFQKKIGKNNSG